MEAAMNNHIGAVVLAFFCGLFVELLFVAGVELLGKRRAILTGIVAGVQWTAILYGVSDNRPAYVVGCATRGIELMPIQIDDWTAVRFLRAKGWVPSKQLWHHWTVEWCDYDCSMQEAVSEQLVFDAKEVEKRVDGEVT